MVKPVADREENRVTIFAQRDSAEKGGPDFLIDRTSLERRNHKALRR